MLVAKENIMFWNSLPDGWKYWLIFVCPLIAILLAGLGCSSVYPKMLDDPATIKAFQEMVRDSNKTWQGSGSVTNPSIGFYYVMGVEARMVGVDARIGAQGASGPQKATALPPVPEAIPAP